MPTIHTIPAATIQPGEVVVNDTNAEWYAANLPPNADTVTPSDAPVATVGTRWDSGHQITRVTFATGVTWVEYHADAPITVRTNDRNPA